MSFRGQMIPLKHFSHIHGIYCTSHNLIPYTVHKVKDIKGATEKLRVSTSISRLALVENSKTASKRGRAETAPTNCLQKRYAHTYPWKCHYCCKGATWSSTPILLSIILKTSPDEWRTTSQPTTLTKKQLQAAMNEAT